MHIVVENTPNPLTRMFLPGARVSDTPRTWRRLDDAESDLLQAIFAVAPVTSILANDDAFCVSVESEDAWADAVPGIVAAISEHVASFVMPEAKVREFDDDRAGDFDEADSPVVEKIKDLIHTHIRPAVARDGGDIVFKSYRGGVLALEMRGACSGCPSSAATLKNGIQNLMTYFVPEVNEVVAA